MSAVGGKADVETGWSDSPKADVVFYVDKETSYVVAMKTSVFDPAMGDTLIAVYYSDHTEYEGVMLPNSTDIDVANGTITIEFDYSKTEIDVKVDEAIFEKP